MQTRQFRYKNLQDQDISKERARLLKSYYKEAYIDSELKTIELIEDESVKYIHYYLSPQEVLEQILMNYGNTEISIYSTEYQSDHRIRDCYSYRNSNLLSKTKSVINSHLNTICFTKISLKTGEPIVQSIEKYYYRNNVLKYQFDYNADGSCFMITDQQDFSADILANEIGSPEIEFSWNGFEYYQFAEPVIPLYIP